MEGASLPCVKIGKMATESLCEGKKQKTIAAGKVCLEALPLPVQ